MRVGNSVVSETWQCGGEGMHKSFSVCQDMFLETVARRRSAVLLSGLGSSRTLACFQRPHIQRLTSHSSFKVSAHLKMYENGTSCNILILGQRASLGTSVNPPMLVG